MYLLFLEYQVHEPFLVRTNDKKIIYKDKFPEVIEDSSKPLANTIMKVKGDKDTRHLFATIYLMENDIKVFYTHHFYNT